MEKLEWTQVLLPLLTLALRFEREGQYSLAKLARAAVDALGRRAAFENEKSLERADLVAELERVTDAVARLGLDDELVSAFRHGATALSEGRLALIHQTPHPYVCRTCGQIVMGEVQDKCPTCGAWPDTFQWFAPIYWLDALDPLESIAQLRRMPQVVANLLDGLPERAFERQPQDGGWDLRNIMTHLRDAQGVLIYRLELFLKEEHPVLSSQAILVLPGLTRIQTRLTPFAALGLVIVMVGAAVWHFPRNEAANVIMNLVIAGLMGFLAYGRWRLSPIKNR